MRCGILLLLLFAGLVAKPIHVLYLPFDDKVKLNEAWDLSVDVPRWFSVTVDTIGRKDSSIVSVPFDSILGFLKQNQWKQDEYLNARVLRRLAATFNADFIVCGTVRKFEVMERAINTGADLGVSNSITSNIGGSGGASMVGGLQSFSAKVAMTVDIYAAGDGTAKDHVDLDSEKKDGGLKVALPGQGENDEMNFYFLSRTPFGSVPFQRSVVGALMRNFSSTLSTRLTSLKPERPSSADTSSELLEGKILERDDKEVYINLGVDDNLFKGEALEVLKPDHPVRDEKGDTLGWAEVPAATIKVVSVKSTHFSLAKIEDEKTPIEPGWTVRSKR